MKVIYKAPGCPPEPREIPNTLAELQDCVGGNIETVTFASDAVVICNEEGRLLGLPHNCFFSRRQLRGTDFGGWPQRRRVHGFRSVDHGCTITTPRRVVKFTMTTLRLTDAKKLHKSLR